MQDIEVRKPSQIIRRGDSFDIGTDIVKQPEVLNILQNPGQLENLLDLTESQAENLRAVITGGGAGLASKFLSKYFGDEIAGAIGGFLGAHVAKRVVKRK